MPLSQTTITGTIYTTSGEPAAGVNVYANRAIKTGVVIQAAPKLVAISDASGVLHRVQSNGTLGDEGFYLPRAATVYLEAQAEGLNVAGKGVALSIPDASSATLESLISVSQVPSTGITVKSNGSSLTNPIGAVDFSSAFVVTESPTGEANIALADNPFPDYLTQAEGDARYDALNAASSAITAHVAAADPHTQYLTQARGDARYYTEGEVDTALASNATADRARANHAGTQAATTITEDSTHRFATDAEKSTWNSKQDGDADLSAIAGLDSSTSGAIASDGAGWIKKTYAQLKTALALAIADVSGLVAALAAKLDANGAITGATKTKVTYDSKGLITSGADATTADIADSADRRYVTDAQRTVVQNTSGVNAGDQDLSGYVPTSRTVNGHALSSNVAVTKSDVGLGNADNTSDATKNAAVATLTNKTLTAPVINNPTGIVKGDVGLGNADNTSDANKPISSATQTALNTKQNSLGYTAENVANKDTDVTLAANSDTKYASQKATKAYADTKASLSATATTSILLGAQSVNLNEGTGAKQNIYTCPASRKCVVTNIIVEHFSGNGTTTRFSLGWDAGAGDVTLTTIDVSAFSVVATSILNLAVGDVVNGSSFLGTPTTRGNAGEVLGLRVDTPEGSALTAIVHVFGYLTDNNGVAIPNVIAVP